MFILCWCCYVFGQLFDDLTPFLQREHLLAYLDEVMAPFVKNLPTYVKDTNHALRIFDSFNFDESDARPRFHVYHGH